jgi:hypothetical protein
MDGSSFTRKGALMDIERERENNTKKRKKQTNKQQQHKTHT